MSRVATYSGPFERRFHGIGSLGDQIYDPVSGTYVDSLSAQDNPVAGTGPLPPPLASTGYNVADVSYPSGSTPQQPGSVSVPTAVISSALNTVSRPSPTVAVPLSPSSLGLWFTSATFGVPNWALGLGVLALAVGLASGGGRRR